MSDGQDFNINVYNIGINIISGYFEIYKVQYIYRYSIEYVIILL